MTCVPGNVNSTALKSWLPLSWDFVDKYGLVWEQQSKFRVRHVCGMMLEDPDGPFCCVDSVILWLNQLFGWESTVAEMDVKGNVPVKCKSGV
eukprot:5599613-Ditylum_brightwellii.AAC.1